MPTSVAQTLNKMKLGGADKVLLATLFNGLVDDLETMRAKYAALTAKLDVAGASVAGLGTNYAATVGVPTSALTVKKS